MPRRADPPCRSQRRVGVSAPRIIRIGGLRTRECSASTMAIAEPNTAKVISPSKAAEGARIPSNPASRASVASSWQRLKSSLTSSSSVTPS